MTFEIDDLRTNERECIVNISGVGRVFIERLNGLVRVKILPLAWDSGHVAQCWAPDDELLEPSHDH